jgi:hypothetical protein
MIQNTLLTAALLLAIEGTAVANENYESCAERNVLVAQQVEERAKESLVSRLEDETIKTALGFFKKVNDREYHGDLMFYMLLAEETDEKETSRGTAVNYKICVQNLGDEETTQTLKFEGVACGIRRTEKEGTIIWPNTCFGPSGRFEKEVTLQPGEIIVLNPRKPLYHRYKPEDTFVLVPHVQLTYVNGVRLPYEKEPDVGMLIPHNVDLK